MTDPERYWERIGRLYEDGKFAGMTRKYGLDAVHSALIKIADGIIAGKYDMDLSGHVKGYVDKATRSTHEDDYRHWGRRVRGYNPDIHRAGRDFTIESEARLTLALTLSKFHTLSPAERRLMDLCAGGYRNTEIAAMTGMTRGTASGLMWRARQRLHRELGW